MKYAIISDIHGNLQALEAVLEDIKRRGIKKIFCLGDIVGYGANPKECLDLIRERGITCVRGNHDEAVLKESYSTFNHFARISLIWTRRKLREDDFKFLESLPLILEHEDFVMVHSSLINPADFDYLYEKDYENLNRNFSSLAQGKKLFIGHTHKPFHINAQENKGREIINAGSIGQPRDGNPKASYVIYHRGVLRRGIEIVRVEYDVEEAATRIRQEGLPDFLASRLYVGI